jgi:hypothetical protein
MFDSFGRLACGEVDVAVTSVAKRLNEREQVADAQSRELRIQFERGALIVEANTTRNCIGSVMRLTRPQGIECR